MHSTFLGLISLLLGTASPVPLQPMPWPALVTASQWSAPWLTQLNATDSQAEAIVEQYVATLASQGFSASAQGVWVQAGATALASHQGIVPLPVASLTKLATTLAALRTWPVDHQFETLVGYRGTIQNGVLQGDLIVQGGRDPYFVWEEAIALGNALQALGLQRVTGNLVIVGDFSMNFDPDPYDSGELLREGLDSARWSAEAQQYYATLPPGTKQPNLWIEGEVVLGQIAAEAPPKGLIRHQSLPLVALLKAMNIYSNNAMADLIALGTGGANTVAAKVVAETQLPLEEVRFINGSGLGVENQMSPRAVVVTLQAIQKVLQPQGLSVSDVMPVMGQEIGTLVGRDLPTQSALKTGTLAEVSSLAGVFYSRDRGPIWFAILNQGYNLDGFRVQQDALLRSLESHWGSASPSPELQPKVKLGQAPYWLGDPKRNQADGE
ncbi:MAG: D-alanyl-D-alanine carboxypeptidase [Cyanobacteria bacterium]|nr:D-alanyl-D-alanine carboxypeptidase [Cyanobacteriota bacterium]MDA0866845.1 D-alanyl-D-alanine carboxypeptidase [Cyanobacteriota bacterium]